MKLKKSESAKVNSSLSKDINRIRKVTEKQIRMNILRKHQIKLLDNFLENLIGEGRISREELKEYMPKKKEAERRLFGGGKKFGNAKTLVSSPFFPILIHF